MTTDRVNPDRAQGLSNHAPSQPQSGRERRRRRSEDPVTALHYQLATVRRDAAMDAVVLADETGCLVAGAGAWPVCEELAAYAPLIGRGGLRSVVSARVALVSAQAEHLVFEIDGQQVWLCGRGGSEGRRSALERARTGISRILGNQAA
jgi:hypothetical protein